MNFKTITPPRKFKVGSTDRSIQLSHVMDLFLTPDEQLTLKTEKGGEVDICRKEWGYYATPSLNGRLKKFGYKSCLVDSMGRRYIHIVEKENMAVYFDYLLQ